MNKKNDEKIDLNKIPRDEMLKYEIAEELGLLDQVLESGWKSLSAKETGPVSYTHLACGGNDRRAEGGAGIQL